MTSEGRTAESEFVLLGIPDVNGSLRGKALRPGAFESALRHGTVMTDLILGLDPVDTPITDYERFGIRSGAADLIVERGLVERVRERGPGLLADLEAALSGSEIVREVRGRGFLLGVELVDPRDGTSFLPDDLDAASLVDDTAFERGLLVTSTHPQADGYAGDQVLLAPAYTSTDAELAEMVERLAATIGDVERTIKSSLMKAGS